MNKSANTIDEYIGNFPDEIQLKLQDIRRVIAEVAPEAEEAIKYAMPTFVFHGNLVHFAAYKNHIGFYPAPDGILAYEEELAGYKRSKGAIQFALDQEVPLALIAKIVQFRLMQNLEKARKKPSKKLAKE